MTGKMQRIYDELYSSEEYHKVQRQRRSDDCQLERVIASMMFWSDATCLAQFGHATAWPIYLFFGNLSKYRRASPNTGPCHSFQLYVHQFIKHLVQSTDSRSSFLSQFHALYLAFGNVKTKPISWLIANESLSTLSGQSSWTMSLSAHTEMGL